MSDVKTNYDLEQIKINFDKLLENLSNVLSEVRPRTNILNTKLGKIKNDLDKLYELDNNSLSKISEIATKYNAINYLFCNNITFNKKDLAKIIEGAHDYQKDSDETYNDFFFELSMAVRFLHANQETCPNVKTEINLDSECDIIIDGIVAIECKYIHSMSGLVKNVRKAKKQIEKRVGDGQAKFGFIALDLSHVCQPAYIQEFIDYTFERFLKNRYKLKNKLEFSDSIIKSILNDRNFYKIISSYIMSEIESMLYSELGFTYDMGQYTHAIIYQSLNSYCFEHEDSVVPLTTRGMSYIINRNLSPDEQLRTRKTIHSLAVGV